MSLPDFVIIGAMKSGTTTLQTQLAAQPGIFMTTPKEPNFFSDDAVYAKGLPWYNSLYAEAAPGDLKGEASTHYTKLPTYPDTIQRLAQAVPAPRLVYVIRNPVNRAISHYIHEWSQGNMGQDPTEAFNQHGALVDYGRYAMQIAPYVAQFGVESICLTSLEQLKSDPAGELARVGAHIGAAGSLAWDPEIGARNVSADRVRRLPLQGLLIDNPVAEFLRRALVPKALRAGIRKARTMDTRPELSDDLRQQLEAVFAKDQAHLATFFPDHPALTACYPFCAE